MRSPTVSTPTSHWKHIIHQRFHIYFKNNSVFLLSLFCRTKPLQCETLSLSSVNVSEWGVWMCWLNVKTGRNTHQTLHVFRVWLGIDCLQIALQLLLVLNSAIMVHCTVSQSCIQKNACIWFWTCFQQVAQNGPPKRSEWAKRKKRLMAFFTGDFKVNDHVLYSAEQRCCCFATYENTTYPL